MKLRMLSFVLLLVGLMSWSATAQAALISGWDFDPLTGGAGDFGPSPYAPISSDPNVLAGGLTRHWTLGTGTGAMNAWGGNNFNTTSPDFDSAVSNNNFATFTIQANPGYTVSLSDIAAYNVRRSGTGPTTGRWQYQIDAGSFFDITSDIAWGGTTSSAGNAQAAIVLSGINALQNVADSSVITLRVVTWGATSTGGTWYLNDPTGTPGIDFAVNGNAVPEPGTMTLLGLGFVSIVGVRLVRRRRKLA
ncbi:MAG: PEP-CTERM sorting domain-containing protein [Planctomycetes bacterium]|nr:PEP-CTERM sorting domain-containing protein [Planctomycetota bacterium]